MNVRAATVEDLVAIAQIQALSPEASQWEPESYLHYDCSVAVERQVVGFLVTRQTAPGEREILNLAVDPAQRRRGVARALLETELGREKTQWFLEVRESNLGAITLYQSAGFRVAGRRESYYSNPLEPGIVMKFNS
jgi:[ribosomal protein S18]-alanine N-acetyltransferase